MRDTLAQLQRLAADAEARGHAVTVASQAYRARAIDNPLPLLLVPLQGEKRLYLAGQRYSCLPGGFLMLHGAARFDVENLPPPDRPYYALALAFDWPTVTLAREILARHGVPETGSRSVSQGPLAAILPALDEFLAQAPVDAAALEHRQLGLLLALARAGHGDYLRPQVLTTAERVRLILAQDPGRDWHSSDLEEALAMSGATLRRRLAEEDQSLRELLRDVRLHQALFALQSTRRPLKAVAFAAGYRSVASFSRRFTERFGVAPAQVAPGQVLARVA